VRAAEADRVVRLRRPWSAPWSARVPLDPLPPVLQINANV